MEGRQAENNILPVLPGERAKIQGLRLTERAAAEDKKGSPNRRFGGVLVPLPPRAKELAPGGAKLPQQRLTEAEASKKRITVIYHNYYT